MENSMITEDYVSFETAKLLKEKGFDEACTLSHFDLDAYKKWFETAPRPITIDADSEKPFRYPVPTLQMAMKWLREVHNLFIEIDRYYFVVDRLSHIASGFKYSIKIKTINTVYTYNDCKSYEEASEAAIKYCLENLI